MGVIPFEDVALDRHHPRLAYAGRMRVRRAAAVVQVVVPIVVAEVMRVIVRMRMHGAIGMPVHGPAVDLRLAFAATAYRAHATLLRQPSGQLDVLDPQLVAASHL